MYHTYVGSVENYCNYNEPLCNVNIALENFWRNKMNLNKQAKCVANDPFRFINSLKICN